jgi:hypothetical protein
MEDIWIIMKPSTILIEQLKKIDQRCYYTNDDELYRLSCFVVYLDDMKNFNHKKFKRLMGIMACEYYKYIKLFEENNNELVNFFDQGINMNDLMLKIDEDNKIIITTYNKSLYINKLTNDEKYVLQKYIERTGNIKTLKELNPLYNFEKMIDDYYNLDFSIKKEIMGYYEFINKNNIEYNDNYIQNIKKDNNYEYNNFIKEALTEFYIWKKSISDKIEISYLEQIMINKIEKNDYNEILNFIENSPNTMKMLIEEYGWYTKNNIEISKEESLDYLKKIDKYNILDKFKIEEQQKKKTL